MRTAVWRQCFQGAGERLKFMRFAGVGAVGTLVHGGLLILFVESLGWSPPPANTIAFLCANLVGFVSHSRFTFRVQPARSRYLRFLLVSVFGAFLSYAISLLGLFLHWNFLIAFLLQIILMPIMTFRLLRRFVFPT